MDEQNLFQLLKIFREKVSNLDKTKYAKSLDQAIQLRFNGNEMFSDKEFEKSIDLYTEVSIMSKCLPSAH